MMEFPGIALKPLNGSLTACVKHVSCLIAVALVCSLCLFRCSRNRASVDRWLLAYAASVFAGAHVSFEDLLRDAMHFCRFMPLHSASLYGFGGLSESQMEALRKMLADRGVPDDALNDRIHGALSKLGPGPIAKALQADNQWQALKAAGSAPNPLFRWIRPEELQAFAQNKANQKFWNSHRQRQS